MAAHISRMIFLGGLRVFPVNRQIYMKQIGVAIVGCGGIALQNHLPGLAMCPDARVVALCDADAATLQRASQQTGITATSTKYEEIVKRDDVNAVIIATPNIVHGPIALAAI